MTKPPLRPGPLEGPKGVWRCLPPPRPSPHLPLLLLLLLGQRTGYASEFPERECCDPLYPVPAPPVPAPPTTTPPATTQRIETGLNTKTAVSILNCILARQLCQKDAACSAILEIIPRVCGTEYVACSTVTVTKCQAAIRTLQAFPVFRPTCLCREPHLDPQCNTFRDFLFDHPCVFVKKKGKKKDPYPVDALPTCHHALEVCEHDTKCGDLYKNFKSNCKVRDGQCRMEDWEMCHDAWTKLRMSPMFGCICPNNNMKRRCDRIFSVVNHNPCVVQVISSESAGIDGTESQVENPLVGLKGSVQKDINAITYEVRGITDLVNTSIIDEEGDPGGTMSVTKSPNHAPPSPDNEEPRPFQLHGTCLTALQGCVDDTQCRPLLQPVLQYCQTARCSRQLCMQVLQNFYRSANPKRTLEVAFCLCKKTTNSQDACLLAQEQLHPICAQRVQDAELPFCHALGENCRAQQDCRHRLEYYEQACAVDSDTKKCAGPSAECREAMLGILGTDLRTNCMCKGTEVTQLYDCLGWQRLLWFNPCVVESQKDYHRLRMGVTYRPPTTLVATSLPPLQNHVTLPPPQYPNEPQILLPTPAGNQKRPATHSSSSTSLETSTPNQSTSSVSFSSTSTEMSTSTTTITTTVPPRSCALKRPDQSDQHIREGTGKRLYKDDDVCSEVCTCHEGEPPQVSCQVMDCIQRKLCDTSFASYSHAAPAYQAYRGQCICYSGHFICMRPPKDAYTLEFGIFLMVGLSRADEMMLKNHTHKGADDLLEPLQELLDMFDKKHACRLRLYQMIDENVIIQAKLSDEPEENITSIAEVLKREKDECMEPLRELRNRINEQHPDIRNDMLLSILKVAELDDNLPNFNGAMALSSGTSTHCLFFLVVLLTWTVTSIVT